MIDAHIWYKQIGEVMKPLRVEFENGGGLATEHPLGR
jgi:hypothetical protein